MSSILDSLGGPDDLKRLPVAELDRGAEHIVLRDPANGVYRRLAVNGDRLTGVVLVGDRLGSNWYAELIEKQCDIAALRPGLMFGREVAEMLNPAAMAPDRGEQV